MLVWIEPAKRRGGRGCGRDRRRARFFLVTGGEVLGLGVPFGDALTASVAWYRSEALFNALTLGLLTSSSGSHTGKFLCSLLRDSRGMPPRVIIRRVLQL